MGLAPQTPLQSAPGTLASLLLAARQGHSEGCQLSRANQVTGLQGRGLCLRFLRGPTPHGKAPRGRTSHGSGPTTMTSSLRGETSLGKSSPNTVCQGSGHGTVKISVCNLELGKGP